MDHIRISNDATYFPVSLTDVMLAAPLVSRVILGGGPGFDEGSESDPAEPMDLTNGAGTTLAARQPDSESLRTWEVAGTAHADQGSYSP